MHHIGIICWAACLVLGSGCSPYHCVCGKRASEQKCPTDIRQANCWCFGEDAIFHGPCGPGEEFYGHQPTDWRAWPASGADWRDAHCSPPVPLIPYEEVIPVEEELLHAPSAYLPPAPSAATDDNFDDDAPLLKDLKDRPSPALDTGAGTPTPGTQPPVEHAAQQPPPSIPSRILTSGQSQQMVIAAANSPDHVQSPVAKTEREPALAAESLPTGSKRRKESKFQLPVIEGPSQPTMSAHKYPVVTTEIAFAARLPQVDATENPTPVSRPTNHAPDNERSSQALNKGAGKPVPGAQPPVEHAGHQPPSSIQPRILTSGQSQPMIRVAPHVPDYVRAPVAKPSDKSALAADNQPTGSKLRKVSEFQELVIEGPSQPRISAHKYPVAITEIAFAARLPQDDTIENPTPATKPTNRAADFDEAIERDSADVLRRFMSISPQTSQVK